MKITAFLMIGYHSRNDKTHLSTMEPESLRVYLQAATSDNTRKAYRSAIRQFEKWGGRLPTNRENLVKYLLERSKILNPRTLDLHLTAIKQWHQVQGFTDPVQDPLIRKTMEGIRRIHGKPKQKAKALRLEHLSLSLVVTVSVEVYQLLLQESVSILS